MQSNNSFKNIVILSLLVAMPFCLWSLTSTEVVGVFDRLFIGIFGLSNGLLFFTFCQIFSFFNNKLLKLFTNTLVIASYSLIIPIVFYNLYYGLPFSASSIIVLLETNHQEAIEYFNSISWWVLSLLLIVFVLIEFGILLFTNKILNNTFGIGKKQKFIYLGAIVFVYLICITKNDLLFQDNMFFALKDIVSQYKSDKLTMLNQKEEFRKQNKDIKISRELNEDESETYIMVIGESHSRNHMSLYGYERNTNPKLNEIKNELLIFNDVISPNNTTIKALQKVLTFANCENEDAFKSIPGLLHILNKAGFDTYWISNQNYTGEHDCWTTIFSQEAKEKYFTNHVTKINSMPVFDEAVFEPLSNVLKKTNKKKFIIVHLLGSHQRADFRYPLKFAEFINISNQPTIHKQAGIFSKRYVNSYDNSVLYNDFIVRQIIEKLRERNEKSFLLYFSDHGEEVCEKSNFYGHIEGVSSKYMVEIPMIMWQSNNLKKENNFNHEITNRPYQTDDIIHSIIDLLDIQCDYYIPQKSIFHPSFQKEKRFINNHYDYDSLFHPIAKLDKPI